MAPWKKLLLIGVGAGFGFAAFLGCLAGAWFWYRSRPPKPWNTSAITARFDKIDTLGQNNDVAFYYVLQNTTERDYRIASSDGVYLTGKLTQEKSLSAFDGYEKIHYPLFIPAKHSLRCDIEIPYPYPQKLAESASEAARKQWRQQLLEFVKSHMGNLGGFVLFDNHSRYQINFPRPW